MDSLDWMEDERAEKERKRREREAKSIREKIGRNEDLECEGRDLGVEH